MDYLNSIIDKVSLNFTKRTRLTCTEIFFYELVFLKQLRKWKCSKFRYILTDLSDRCLWEGVPKYYLARYQDCLSNLAIAFIDSLHNFLRQTILIELDVIFFRTPYKSIKIQSLFDSDVYICTHKTFSEFYLHLRLQRNYECKFKNCFY